VSVPRVDVVDTLGAGDVLHGALAAWLAVRGTGDVAGGLAWASRLAADSCAAPGARGWMTDMQHLAEYRASLASGPAQAAR
jgi:sugar/nucleoside kinase (ribokinase family)